MAHCVPGAPPPTVPISPLTVLIADDSPTDRLILARLVTQLGHVVISAENGLQALQAFLAQRPDLVLLDALMPVMDGFEAARQIKQACGEDLVPIIFLTSLTDTSALVQCLQAGGDDFLTKPYNPVILQAKILAFNRMQDMHQTLQQQRDLIARQHQQLVQEQQLAKIIFDRVAHAGSLGADNLRYLQSPYAMFNGDILLAAYKPSGGMHILLGDFTGHGLSAAIGAMPLAEVFYAMTVRGFNLRDILVELNSKLGRILPLGIFCCAVLVEVNPAKGLVEIWNGGLPEVLVLGSAGDILQRVPSTHLPLAVARADRFDPTPVVLPLTAGERLLCWTDGVIESRNQRGEQFGEQRVLAVVENYVGKPEGVFDGLLQALEAFHGSPEDDISVLEVVMQPTSLALSLPQAELFQPDARQLHSQDWQLTYTFRAASIREHNPLPFLLKVLLQVPGLRVHVGSLFTILSELYSNALEHGLLQLDSGLKADYPGFARYYQQRKQRLRDLREGWISVSLDHRPDPLGGVLRIEVTDSGSGFTPPTGPLAASVATRERAIQSLPGSADGYCGRGLALVGALVDELEFNAAGNRVRVVFVWQLGHTAGQQA